MPTARKELLDAVREQLGLSPPDAVGADPTESPEVVDMQTPYAKAIAAANAVARRAPTPAVGGSVTPAQKITQTPNDATPDVSTQPKPDTSGLSAPPLLGSGSPPGAPPTPPPAQVMPSGDVDKDLEALMDAQRFDSVHKSIGDVSDALTSAFTRGRSTQKSWGGPQATQAFEQQQGFRDKRAAQAAAQAKAAQDAAEFGLKVNEDKRKTAEESRNESKSVREASEFYRKADLDKQMNDKASDLSKRAQAGWIAAVPEARGVVEDMTAAELKDPKAIEVINARIEAVKNRQAQKDAAALSAGNKPIPAAQVVDLAGLASAEKMTDALFEDWKKHASSFGSSVLQHVKGTDPAVFQKTRTATIQLVGGILEGGKLTDSDYAKYDRLFPTASDTEKEARSKMAVVKQMLELKRAGATSALGQAGYNASGLSAPTPSPAPSKWERVQ